uniref:Reverse transcriptase Ty1/copia-type domain-containing protein n=1 Tax=Solanum lycopersicum TaxID=4081 RepID=A0A3Q7EDQ7_SOLLC
MNFPQEVLVDQSIDIWVMKKYGVRESWVKELTVGPILIMTPLSIWKNETKLMIESKDGTLVSCNMLFHEIKDLHMSCVPNTWEAMLCKESLISIMKERETSGNHSPGNVTRHAQQLSHQSSKYARDLLQKTGLEKCTSQPTPMAYLAITRPDIQFAVNRVAQRMPQPSEHDYHCLKRILRYIFGTLGRGLLIRPRDMELRGFSDSDWANDKNDRKSTSGFLIFLGPNLISWCTKK